MAVEEIPDDFVDAWLFSAPVLEKSEAVRCLEYPISSCPRGTEKAVV
jgi:hypothetical protein